LIELARKYKIHIFNHGISYSKETGYSIDAVAVLDDIQMLEKNGYIVQILENLDESGKASQKEVGKGNYKALHKYMSKSTLVERLR